MKLQNKLTLLAIDILKYPLLLFYDRCTLDRAWLLQTFKGSKCAPSFCDTPDTIIQSMIDVAKKSLNGQVTSGMLNILEPEFGSGAILKKIDSNFNKANITGIEWDPKIYAQVYTEYKKHGAFKMNFIKFLNMNFLAYKKDEHHLALMNPPYEGKRFIGHINHAIKLLKPGGVLVALLPESTFYSLCWRCIQFRKSIRKHAVTEVSKIGTQVCNYPVSVCMLKIVKK